MKLVLAPFENQGVCRMRWSVEIQKTSLELRNLSDLLRGLGFKLVEGIDYPAIASRAFEEMDTSEKVWSAAKKLQDAFKGSAAIDPSFILGSVIDYTTDPPRRHAFLEVDSCTHKVTAMSVDLTIRGPEGLPDQELRDWREKREQLEYKLKVDSQLDSLVPLLAEPKAEEVIAILNRGGHDGVSIYRAYELMEGHPSGRKCFHERFGITKAEFDRFKDAVHNKKVSGQMARHTYEEEPRSADPMSIAQAEIFVRQLAKKWLASFRDG